MESKIKREELRVGNKIRASRYIDTKEAKDDLGEEYTEDQEWLIDTVEGICHPDEDYMYWSALDEEELTYRVEGIPLTDDWMIKLGFISNPYKDRFELYDIHIDCDKTKGRMELWHSRTGVVVHHVHQLQNLYFVLTRQELKIND